MNIKNFQIYIRDSLQHIDLIKSRYPKLPIFILGHSMVSSPILCKCINFDLYKDQPGGAICFRMESSKNICIQNITHIFVRNIV